MQRLAGRYGAIIKHGIAVSILTMLSGLTCFHMLLPFVKDEMLGVIQTSLAVAGLVVGIYFGLVVFLAQKAPPESEPKKL